MSSRLSDIGQVNKFFAILRERLLTVIILSCALATIGCNRAESRKLTPQQVEQVQAARQATIATAERLLGRQLSDSEKECIRDDFKDGGVVGSIAPPLSDTLKQKAESLQHSNKQSETPMPAEGMSKYHYLAADGGPHMLLPVAVAGAWTGVRTAGDVMNPKSDYGRACAAAASAEMAVVPVGSASALVFSLTFAWRTKS